MTEPMSFEAHAVLAPRRTRLARLTLLLPVIILAVVAWAGFSGARVSPAVAVATDRPIVAPSSVAAAVATPELPPAEVIGLRVNRLDEVQTRSLGRDDPVAIVGWYVATAITDCPALDAIYRQAALPDVRGDADQSAFCVRSGVLYATQPINQDSWPSNPGLSRVSATVVVGVIMPPELERIGADAREVVVIGRFVPTVGGCQVPAPCPHELLIDHVAWTPGT